MTNKKLSEIGMRIKWGREHHLESEPSLLGINWISHTNTPHNYMMLSLAERREFAWRCFMAGFDMADEQEGRSLNFDDKIWNKFLEDEGL